MKPFGRVLRIKPSFDYLRQEIEFEGRANRAIQIAGNEAAASVPPQGLRGLPPALLLRARDRIQHGIGGGLELEVDTQQVGPFLL